MRRSWVKYNVLEDNIVAERGLIPWSGACSTRARRSRSTSTTTPGGLDGLPLRDTTKVFLEATIYPVKDPDGKVTNAVIQHLDVTERTLAQEALQETEEVYRSLFDRSLDGILLSRPDGTILDANSVACALLGMTKEEICAVGRQRLLASGPPWTPCSRSVPARAEPRER